MKRIIVGLMALLLVAQGSLFAGGGAEKKTEEQQGPVKILWWSHWANEPAKRQVIEAIKADYMKAHPKVEIELVWWDKNPLQDAWRVAMTAKKGAPDIVTDPAEKIVEQLKAGWFLELGDKFPWQNFYPEVRSIGNKFEGVKGEYLFHISMPLQMILYNRDIFKEIGVTVPPDYQFTAEEFLEIVKKAKAKGYAGLANAIGNRPFPATYLVEYLLLSKVGPEEFELYRTGKKSWNTPEAREVLEFSAQLRDAGIWPPSFASMGIDEFHVYFHTQRKAAMLLIPTWYTGRAFKPVKEGGQDPNFRFGMLRYPKMKNGKGHEYILAGFESGYMIGSLTKHPEVARDILAFASQPKYGALWTAITNSPSAIKYTEKDLPPDMDKTWAWYHEEMNKVYGPVKKFIWNQWGLSGAWTDAVKSVLNEGIPLKLITVDEAIKKLDAAIGK
jgi:ABC-type glycerol-3-phosphate transport system substrate-binding protein